MRSHHVFYLLQSAELVLPIPVVVIMASDPQESQGVLLTTDL